MISRKVRIPRLPFVALDHTADGQPVVIDGRVVSESGGGPDKTILNSPRFFKAEGYRMVCAFMHPSDDPGYEQILRRAEAWCAPLHSIVDRGPFDWRVVASLLDVCRKEGAAIWHGHDYKSNFAGLLLRPLHRMKLVTTVHGWVRHTKRTRLYYAIDRLCLPLYDKVICVSADLVERCLKAGVRADRCVLIENGIDATAYPAPLDPAAAKIRLNLSPSRLVIGAVGRLSPEKGFDLLIRAADGLLTDGHDFDLIIAGEGSEGPKLQALINQLQRTDRIHLLGYRADAAEVFRAMDAFVLSSLREGLPNVLLEAMASGIPVAATRIAGIAELLGDGACGLLFEADSSEAIASNLALLLTNEDLRARLGANGRRRVEERYSFHHRIHKIRLIYDELLERDLTHLR